MFSKENVYFYIHILKSNKSNFSTRRALASALTRYEGVTIRVCTTTAALLTRKHLSHGASH